ncbi:ATP-binding protein [Streptomyces sp. NRRL S-378]|uniref:ATP-binding protein n=1 Tax=Streptomyces sp. NRRL S-378 TaxID=1463904 RepID=UPI00099CDA4B|nr:ATP-binding protein [Streptomyces sp. NRRL S-378]
MEEQTLSSLILPTPARTGLSCAAAREATRDLLAALKPEPGWVDDLLTVVSELVSNASRHAGGATALRITAHSSTVTIEISDRSPSPPRLQPRAPQTPGGFGWRLVNQLATTDTRVHNGGKTITATLTTEAQLPLCPGGDSQLARCRHAPRTAAEHPSAPAGDATGPAPAPYAGADRKDSTPPATPRGGRDRRTIAAPEPATVRT